MKPIRLLLTITVLMLGSACQQLLKSPAAPGGQPRLYQDNFSNPLSGWTAAPVGINNGTAEYSDGVYRISVNAPNRDVWATPGLNLADTRVEVEAIKVGGDRNNRFGIICRATSAGSFYVFLISSDGYYGIGKVAGSQYRLLGSQSLLPDDRIPHGSDYLHLRADCVDDRLILFVNGEKIAEANDDEFRTGDVGLIAGAYNMVGTEILFDNFIVKKP